MRKVILLFLISITLFSPLLCNFTANPQYESPSYLLLNNWVNQSIWIITGIKVPNPQLNGFPILPPSIENLYVKNELLNFSVNFIMSTENAYLTLNN
ncbi:MAG: glycoside hydrolase, partial [Saccharolobus sp.]